MSGTPKFAFDKQTNGWFELEPEGAFEIFVAILAMLYLLAALGFFAWMLFDTWAERNVLMEALGYGEETLKSSVYRLLALTALGGALGGTLDGLRSLFNWHAAKKAYGPRFIWKDVARPWIGGTLGVFVYVFIRGGVGTVSGGVSFGEGSGVELLAAFTIGAVSGFASIQVFKWLDAQADRLFSVSPTIEATAPPPAGVLPADLLGALVTLPISSDMWNAINQKWGSLNPQQQQDRLGMMKDMPDSVDRVNIIFLK